MKLLSISKGFQVSVSRHIFYNHQIDKNGEGHWDNVDVSNAPKTFSSYLETLLTEAEGSMQALGKSGLDTRGTLSSQASGDQPNRFVALQGIFSPNGVKQKKIQKTLSELKGYADAFSDLDLFPPDVEQVLVQELYETYHDSSFRDHEEVVMSNLLTCRLVLENIALHLDLAEKNSPEQLEAHYDNFTGALGQFRNHIDFLSAPDTADRNQVSREAIGMLKTVPDLDKKMRSLDALENAIAPLFSGEDSYDPDFLELVLSYLGEYSEAIDAYLDGNPGSLEFFTDSNVKALAKDVRSVTAGKITAKQAMDYIHTRPKALGKTRNGVRRTAVYAARHKIQTSLATLAIISATVAGNMNTDTPVMEALSQPVTAVRVMVESVTAENTQERMEQLELPYSQYARIEKMYDRTTGKKRRGELLNLASMLGRGASRYTNIVDHYDGEMSGSFIRTLIEANLDYATSSASAESIAQLMPGLRGAFGYEKSFAFTFETHPEAFPSSIEGDTKYNQLFESGDTHKLFEYLKAGLYMPVTIRKQGSPGTKSQLRQQETYEKFSEWTTSYLSDFSKWEDHLDIADFYQEQVLRPDLQQYLDSENLVFNDQEMKFLVLGTYNGGVGGMKHAIKSLKSKGLPITFSNLLAHADYRDDEMRDYMRRGIAMEWALESMQGQSDKVLSARGHETVQWTVTFKRVPQQELREIATTPDGFTLVADGEGLGFVLNRIGLKFPYGNTEAETVNKKVKSGDKVGYKDGQVLVVRGEMLLGQFSVSSVGSKAEVVEVASAPVSTQVAKIVSAPENAGIPAGSFVSISVPDGGGVFTILKGTDHDWKAISEVVGGLPKGSKLAINDGKVAVLNSRDEIVKPWQLYGEQTG